MFETWLRPVFRLRNSSQAISWMFRPATRSRISRSRSVSSGKMRHPSRGRAGRHFEEGVRYPVRRSRDSRGLDRGSRGSNRRSPRRSPSQRLRNGHGSATGTDRRLSHRTRSLPRDGRYSGLTGASSHARGSGRIKAPVTLTGILITRTFRALSSKMERQGACNTTTPSTRARAWRRAPAR